MKNIGIIGNGFVGSAIAAGFALHANVKVFDKDPRKSIHTLEETLASSNFIFISVPTPMQHVTGGKIDLSILDSVFNDIVSLSHLSYDETIFVIKSTVIPGTTAQYVDRYPNLRIVFNPEFLTERSANLDFINASRIVLGGNSDDTRMVAELYHDRFPYTKVIETDEASAEFIKYMCNCFFATKISYMNEMFLVASKIGCDWDKIMEGFMADGRIGNSHIDVPGHDGDYGFGGKCFPKDINAFMGFCNDIDMDAHVLGAVWQRNMSVRTDLDWGRIKGAVSEHDE